MTSTERPAERIFLSYRRADARHIAGRIFDRLEARFGPGHVFMDLDSIEPGLDFGDAIDEAVGSCDVLPAVIGNDWLGAADEHHRRRLDDRNDFVVREITTALRRNVRVIPVLIDGAPMPREDDLPRALTPLARRQAVRFEDTGFDATMTTLLAALERAQAPGQPAAVLPGAVLPGAVGSDHGHPVPTDSAPTRPAKRGWTTEEFALLLRDRRPSARRLVAVLDDLAARPEVDVALSDLATAVGLSRGELRGAFTGLTFFCKQLRPGTEYDWPIICSHGDSTQRGQAQETWYHLPVGLADQWSRARSRPGPATGGADRS